MTTTTAQPAPGRAGWRLGRAASAALDRVWSGGRVDRVVLVAGCALLVSGLVNAGVPLATGGTWTGPVSLRKPATFGTGFGSTLVAVAWATTFVAVRPRVRAVLLGMLTAPSVVEVALVSMQAWRGCRRTSTTRRPSTARCR